MKIYNCKSKIIFYKSHFTSKLLLPVHSSHILIHIKSELSDLLGAFCWMLVSSSDFSVFGKWCFCFNGISHWSKSCGACTVHVMLRAESLDTNFIYTKLCEIRFKINTSVCCCDSCCTFQHWFCQFVSAFLNVELWCWISGLLKQNFSATF